MSYIKFQHKSYGQMITTPEYWIQYELFDATDENGDTMPVHKEDCNDARYVDE